MMTLATIPTSNRPDEWEDIYFDMDDSGNYFLKQGNDWIVFNAKMLALLIDALVAQQNR